MSLDQQCEHRDYEGAISLALQDLSSLKGEKNA